MPIERCLGKLAKRFIDLIMINVSSNQFHFGFVSYLHQAIDAVVWLQTDLVSISPCVSGPSTQG